MSRGRPRAGRRRARLEDDQVLAGFAQLLESGDELVGLPDRLVDRGPRDGGLVTQIGPGAYVVTWA